MKITTLTLWILYCLTPILGTPGIVCYWDQSSSEKRTGVGKARISFLESALSKCTRMIIGFADIDENTLQVVSIPKIPFNCKNKTCPKFILGIGRGIDHDPALVKISSRIFDTNKGRFIKSITKALNDNPGYDGVDLAWQFPNSTEDIELTRIESEEKWFREQVGSAHTPHKPTRKELKERFQSLVSFLRSELEEAQKNLTISVLPHINQSVYYSPGSLSRYVDSIHIFSFEHPLIGELKLRNEDFQFEEVWSRHYKRLKFWLDNGAPGSQIISGFATFARTWQNPLEANKLGKPGCFSQKPGLLSYSEICPKSLYGEELQTYIHPVPIPEFNTQRDIVLLLTKNAHDNTTGYYIPPNMVSNEMEYVKTHDLGGIALYELSLDDPRGLCGGELFPYLAKVSESMKRVFAK